MLAADNFWQRISKFYLTNPFVNFTYRVFLQVEGGGGSGRAVVGVVRRIASFPFPDTLDF